MTDQHPITPPPELRQLWAQQAQRIDPHDPVAWMQHVSAQAARWGADQELEACCGFLQKLLAPSEWITGLRAARRPKPPSLKEQALAELELLRGDANAHGLGFDAPAIRRALEQLDD